MISSLHQSLQVRQSKKQVLRLADKVVKDPSIFTELIQLIATEEAPVSQYGAWVLISLLRAPVHDGVRRSILRSLSRINIPDEHKEEVMDICFQALEHRAEPVAIKMFSMVILYELCQGEVELLQELARQIEIQMPTSTAGFQSRGRKILKALKTSL